VEFQSRNVRSLGLAAEFVSHVGIVRTAGLESLWPNVARVIMAGLGLLILAGMIFLVIFIAQA
jgi:hypothetical protein